MLHRAPHRRRAHGAAALAAKDTERTLLELNKISPTSSDSYAAAVEWFKEWTVLNAVDWSSPPELDAALVEFFEDIYFQGHQASSGSCLVAALEHFHPCLAGIRSASLP